MRRYQRVYVAISLSVANRALASRQPASHATGPLCRERTRRRRCAALTVALILGLLTGCESSPPAGQSPPRPVPPGPYPDLASVPPRPQLGYTVEQRRAIGDQLVADREHARYAAAQLAYATGATTEPPQPPAPPPAAPPAPPPPAPPEGDASIAAAYLDTNLSDVRDTGKLRQFMRRLDREAPDPVGPATVAELLGFGGPGDPPAAARPTPEQPQDDAAAPNVLGGVLGVDEAAATPGRTATATTLPPGAMVAQLPFVAGSAALPNDADAQLRPAVEQARATDAELRIVAPSGETGLGAERARAVAASLVRLGAPANRLDLALNGSGDEVLVYLAASPTS